MKERIVVLLFLLMVRLVLGYYSTFKYDLSGEVRVVDETINVYQKNKICIIETRRFFLEIKNNCASFLDKKITVVGKLERRLIESLEGKIWLVDAKIERLEKGEGRDGLSVKVGDLVDIFRNFLLKKIELSVPSPESGLVAGIILGYKDDIGQDLYQLMVKSGTIHIAVASGYNVLLVGGFVLSLLFWFLKRSWASVFSVFLITFYGILAGGEPPVVRAVWMAAVMYLGMVVGRRVEAIWLLCLTSWVMLMIDPVLMVSISFQLSFAASFGLMVIGPKLSEWIPEKIGLMTTVSTMIATTPILWWHFGRLSIMGLFSNIFVLPLVPPIMILGSLMCVWPAVFSWPTYTLSHMIVRLIEFFGR